MSLHRFALHQNFLDPLWVKDKNGNKVPYGPIRYNEIVKECYLISKCIHTSYLDLMEVTPHERELFISYIADEAEKNKELLNKNKQDKNKKF